MACYPTLGETSPLEATKLADRTWFSRRVRQRIIKALVDRKLIARTKSMGDGRRVELSITPGGQRLIDKFSPEANAIYAALKKRMGASVTKKRWIRSKASPLSGAATATSSPTRPNSCA